MSQQPKITVITGATGGIGFAYAKHLAQKGYELFITASDKKRLDECSEYLFRNYSVNVTSMVTNLASTEDRNRLATRISDMPRIDMLINSAGFGEGSYFHKENIEDAQRMVNVHIVATTQFVHAALPAMIKNKSGQIITVSSLGAFTPAPGSSIYASTKAFLNSFMESIHMEVKKHNIHVQSLCPGLTHTNFHTRGDREASVSAKWKVFWMSADEVVRASMKALGKRHVVYVPGFMNKLTKFVVGVLPSRVYYVFAGNTAKSFQ